MFNFKVSSTSAASTNMRVIEGLNSKSDFRSAYSAQRSSDDWAHFAEAFGISNLSFTPQDTIHSGDDKPKASIKRKFDKLHGSYAPQTKRNEKFIKEFIYRFKLEDELDINPINNPYIGKDSTQLIKVTGFEYRKPFVIISAISADDEHDRLTYTRSMDEVSTFYFTFQIGFTAEGKEHPDMIRLRKFIWNKVDHSGKITLAYLLRQLIGRVFTISTEMMIPQRDTKTKEILFDDKGEMIMIMNPDYLGFPVWDYEDKIVIDYKNGCDYVGSYSNLPKHKFNSSSNAMLVANE